MVGADVAMMTSAVLRHGPEHIATVEAELRSVDDDHEYESVDQLRGSASQATSRGPVGLRAGQLHADAPIVGRAARADADRAVPPGGHGPRDLSQSLVDARPRRSACAR